MQAEAMKLLADAVLDFGKALHSVAETMTQAAPEGAVTQIQSGGDGNVQIGSVASLEINNSEQPPEDAAVKASTPEEDEPQAETELTLEYVQKMLGEKANKGFTKQVRALITKRGVKMVSDLDPKHYAAVLAELKEIK